MTVRVDAIAWSARAADVRASEPSWVVAGDLAAAVGPAAEHEDRLARAERLARLHDAGTILPVQAAELPSQAAVAAWLTQHRDELVEALRRLDGAVELGVRVAKPTEEAAPETTSGPGAAYLARRLAARAEARGLAERLEPLRAHAIEGPLVDADRGVASAAFLVAADGVPRFVAALAELDATLDGPPLVCTGPWPPYSFTTHLIPARAAA